MDALRFSGNRIVPDNNMKVGDDPRSRSVKPTSKHSYSMGWWIFGDCICPRWATVFVDYFAIAELRLPAHLYLTYASYRTS